MWARKNLPNRRYWTSDTPQRARQIGGVTAVWLLLTASGKRMNRLLSCSLKPISTIASRTPAQLSASFATAKDKKEAASAKSKKASKTETKQSEKQLKALLLQYYRLRTHEKPKVDPETQKEYAAAAKEYSRQMTILYHTAEKRLNDKLFLRDLAISALPSEALRADAKKTDAEQIPGKYFYPNKKARFEDLSKELAW